MHSSLPPTPLSPDLGSLLSGLGQALRWLREKQSRKQYRVADTAGITKGMLSAYETGRQRPSLETLDKLLETLGCDLNDLHNALQIVNGRPERIKGWRGWQTSSWLEGSQMPAFRPLQSYPGSQEPAEGNTLGRPGGANGTYGTAGPGSGASDITGITGMMDVREPAPPYQVEPDAQAARRRSEQQARVSADLYSVLGTSRPRLALEEEQALGQMLDGFHSLLRYWHRALAATGPLARQPGGPSGPRQVIPGNGERGDASAQPINDNQRAAPAADEPG